jgi:hypothetical protein
VTFLSPTQAFSFDTRHVPIVCISVAGEITDADLDFLFQRFDTLHARQQKFCLLIDALRAQAPTPHIRQRLRDWARLHENISARYCASSAVVYASRLLVGLLAALNWMKKPPYPQEVFADLSGAITWTLRQATSLDLPLDASVSADALLRAFRNVRD